MARLASAHMARETNTLHVEIGVWLTAKKSGGNDRMIPAITSSVSMVKV